MSAREPRPRPAEILPPTLLFNAVHLAAPPTDRLASLLIACAVYTALGVAALGGARHLATRRPVSELPPVVIFDPEPGREPPPARVQPPPSGGPMPAGFRAVQPPMDPNAIPDYVPVALPTTDRGLEIVGDPNAPAGPRVVGLPPGPPTPAPAAVSRVVELESQAVRALRQVPPVYPSLARMARIQGPVELRMTIDASGVPTDIQVLSGPHPLLVAEALRVARLWRFQPALVDGRAVPASFRLTVAFRLER